MLAERNRPGPGGRGAKRRKQKKRRLPKEAALF